jgi:heat shock protein HslJ
MQTSVASRRKLSRQPDPGLAQLAQGHAVGRRAILGPVAMRSRTSWFWLFGLLVSCLGGADDTGLDLAGREFVSESLEGRALVPGTEVRVGFRASELSASAGCNSMFGDYSFDDQVLVVTTMGSTEIGCDLPLHDQDEWLARFLRARPTAELVEPKLTLSSATETLVLVDREVASPDRPLVDTHWIGDGVGDGSSVRFSFGWTVATIAFGTDGSVEAFTGCQRASGTFAADATTIDFADFAFDGVPCADPALQSLTDAFLFVLDGSQVAFEIEERSLKIERAGSTLYFRSTE